MASSQQSVPNFMSSHFWTIVLLGLFCIGNVQHSDARAVNVSNTWTMPQEGLNVFYRFFRDRISWFEADAVCQFHHANLVTVDNSFQFDATRDLLRELDVNDIVWIGLMRPQSAERFMWSNSRPLVTDTGYWAESLPSMEAPLCAVIDPIRDYRWHALRCGGPETASFLCEMPVPIWADACILKDMPNLTMQYMADTASIELIRNCEEEGLLRQTCKGKQDRERVIRELICPRERMEAQRINEITNSHFKSLQIINSIRTDNNENNDIDLMPFGQNFEAGRDLGTGEEVQTEKNTVQRLIEQFNVDELMQADEPTRNSGFEIPGEIPKPVKKSPKKVIMANGRSDSPPKKEKPEKKYSAPEQSEKKQMKKEQPKTVEIDLDDMMMGDQPIPGEPELVEHVNDDDVSNEIMEPLPHKKKILPQDLKTMATITETPEKVEEKQAKSEESSEEKLGASALDRTTEEVATKESTVQQHSSASIDTSTAAATTTTTTATTTTSTTTTTTTTPSPTTQAPTTQKAEALPTTKESLSTTKSPSTPLRTSAKPEITSPVTVAEIIMSTSVAPEEPEFTSDVIDMSTNEPAILFPLTTLHPSATVGHPMNPQQPKGNMFTEESQHPHVKESADNSHFIPPMLLVKSHYVPPPKHHEHNGHSGDHVHHAEHEYEHHHQYLDQDKHLGTTQADALSGEVLETVKRNHHESLQIDSTSELASHTLSSTAIPLETSTAAAPSTTTKKIEKYARLVEDPTKKKNRIDIVGDKRKVEATPELKLNKTQDVRVQTTTTVTTTIAQSNADATTTTTVKSIELRTTEAQVAADVSTDFPKQPPTSTSTAAPTTERIPEQPSTERTTTATSNEERRTPDVTRALEETSSKPTASVDTTSANTPTTTTATPKPETTTGPATTASFIPRSSSTITSTTVTTTTSAPSTPTTTTATATTTSVEMMTTTKQTIEEFEESDASTPETVMMPDKRTHHPRPTHITHGHHTSSTTHNFMKDEIEPTYHPNRHRTLTKPESETYLHKILG